MNPRRLVYQNWIVDLGRDPLWPFIPLSNGYQGHNKTIVYAVNQALGALTDDEANLLISYYWQGQSYREISRVTGKAVYKLESIRRSAFRKLANKLQKSLGGKYRVPQPQKPACSLCNHPDSKEIDRLIRTKSEEETWRRIVKTLKSEYGIKLATIQILISHYKYHMI
jgi:hypothetical protein